MAKPKVLYLAQVFPHTRGVKWLNALGTVGIDAVVVYGGSGKKVWQLDTDLTAIQEPALLRKLNLSARRTARRIAEGLDKSGDPIGVILARDIFLGRVATELSKLLGVPWFLDLCDNYPEVLRQRSRGSRSWMRVLGPLIDRLEAQAVLGADHTVFVTDESRDYVLQKIEQRCGPHRAKAVRSRCLVVSNPPDVDAPPPAEHLTSEGLVYIGTFDDDIRDLTTVVRGLARYESMAGRNVPLTLLTFDRTRAEVALDKSGIDWRRIVEFEDPVPAAALPGKLAGYLAGLVPHSASPAVDYTISNKIYDYLYAGIAVLASDNPPNVRLLNRVGAGLCYRREDPDDFARVLGELILRRRRGDLPLRSEELFPTESWEHQSQPLLETLSRHIGAEIPVGSGKNP